MTTLTARAEKSHVLCGIVDCGFRLGRIEWSDVHRTINIGDEEKFKAANRLKNAHPDGPLLELRVHLGPGWLLSDEDIWEMTKHAEGRLREGKKPAYVRGWLPGMHAQKSFDPPAMIRCPLCGWLQTVKKTFTRRNKMLRLTERQR